MDSRARVRKPILVIPVLFLGLVSCIRATPPQTAQEVADVLTQNGIAYSESEPISFSGMKYARIDEGLRLAGEGLRVEVLRIEDPRTFKIMASTGVLLGAIGTKVESEALSPPDMLVRRPFVVVIREEPEPGRVRAVLERALPAAD